jgi:hypothetical protein
MWTNLISDLKYSWHVERASQKIKPHSDARCYSSFLLTGIERNTNLIITCTVVLIHGQREQTGSYGVCNLLSVYFR